MNYATGLGFAPFPAAPFNPGYPMAVFGADPTPATTPSALDRFKAALGQQNSIVPVKNGTLLAAAAAGGLLLYGSSAGWFGGRRRR